MVVSLLTNNMASAGALLTQADLDSSLRWRQSPQASSPNGNHQSTLLDFSTTLQSEESSMLNCYSSDNVRGDRTSSPHPDTSRSSGSEDNSGPSMYPITVCSAVTTTTEYSNSENESSQPSPISSYNDEDGYRTSTTKTTSAGKVKVHKCRSCGFSTTDKNESWLHIAMHMKPEKILRCPECPFVTEYKHHLDFHVWNHQGMKPYKCDKCPYVCVNKSMLKSHMKSHSNVYQYRCANCAYRTKYCHSLKIHLRKYRHEPGLVLDSDGNPNPNPVIDVYGNRRGPKQKPKKQDSPTITPSIPNLPNYQNFPWMGNLFFGDPKLHSPTLIPSFLGPMFGTEHKRIEVPQAEDHKSGFLEGLTRVDNNNDDRQLNLQSCSKEDVFSSRITEELFDRTQMNLLNLSALVKSTPCVGIPSTSSVSATDTLPDELNIARLPKQCDSTDCVPLNLSLTQSSTNAESIPSGSVQSVKNRRKGIACKLKRSYASAEEDQDEPKALKLDREVKLAEATQSFKLAEATQSFKLAEASQSFKLAEVSQSLKAVEVSQSIKSAEVTQSSKATEMPQSVRIDSVCTNTKRTSAEEENELMNKLKNKKSLFYCSYCEITFFNQVMFTMHMGYHGYSDPFTCNRCGEKTEDSIAFYAHMMSSAHV